LTLHLQILMLTAWTAGRQRLTEGIERSRHDRGELTAGVIFLVALAVAAAAVAVVIVDRINSHAETIP
jgi:hypothetical protein